MLTFQILHQKYEMEMSLTGMKKTKEQIEEMNIQLQAVSRSNKGKMLCSHLELRPFLYHTT